MPLCRFVKPPVKNYIRYRKNDIRLYLNDVRHYSNNIRHCFRHFPQTQNALPEQKQKSAVYHIFLADNVHLMCKKRYFSL